MKEQGAVYHFHVRVANHFWVVCNHEDQVDLHPSGRCCLRALINILTNTQVNMKADCTGVSVHIFLETQGHPHCQQLMLCVNEYCDKQNGRMGLFKHLRWLKSGTDSRMELPHQQGGTSRAECTTYLLFTSHPIIVHLIIHFVRRLAFLFQTSDRIEYAYIPTHSCFLKSNLTLRSSES